MELVLGDRDLDDGEICALVDALDLAGGGAPVAETNLDPGCAADHVRIRQDVALFIDHDA